MEYIDRQVGVVLDRVDAVFCSECRTRIDVSGIKPFSEAVCPVCHHGNVIPARLGNFLLLGLIGTGGMGGIYYARDETLNRDVAIKVMLKSLGEDVSFVESFKREAQAAAQINHPNIAQIYSFGQEKGQPYIVMELVRGSKFAGLVEAGDPVDQTAALRVGIQVAEGLRAASDADLVHGDVKPENILIDSKGQAKLVDFGLASRSKQQVADGIWGTPYYIAPEKARRLPPDLRSDIYSLGATLYHALAGKPPFEGETPTDVVKARLGNPPPPLREVRPGIDPEVDRIVSRMLEEEPSRRYPTYESLLSDMRKVLSQIEPKARGSGITVTRPKKMTIKKKSVPRIKLDPAESESGSASDALAEYRKKALGGKQAGRGGGGGKGPLIVFLVVVVLVVIGVIVLGVGMVVRKRDAEIRTRREQIALRSQIEKADAAYAGILKLSSRTSSLAELTAGLPEKASNSVFVILGETIACAPPKPPVLTNAAPADAAITNEAGVATNAPVEGEEEAAPEPTPADERPAMVSARNVIDGVFAVRSAAEAARIAADSAIVVRDAAAAARSVQAAVSNTAVLAEMGPGLEQSFASAEKTMRSVDSAMKELLALEARTVKEREEEAGRLALLLQQRREEEARQKKVADELARAERLESEAMPLYVKMRFAEAHKTLSDAAKGFDTDEGRARIALPLDRFRYLRNMKEFLIAAIMAEPFRYGWGLGAGARDVTGADENGIQITGGSVLWEQMRVPHIAHLMDHYLSKARTKTSVLAEQNLAMGICHLLGGNAEEAVRYRDKAIQMAPYLDAEARRLVPGFMP